MNQYIAATKSFAIAHKKKITVGAEIALGVLVLAIVALLFLYNMPKDTYQAVKACDLLTPIEAQDLLGNKVIGLNPDAPIISDDTATSKCSYSDTNHDEDKMRVAAVAVRTGINTKGVQENKKDFATNKSAESVEAVKNIGDSAYFDKSQGQLNILRGHEWIILSYGVGATPQDNTLDEATKLAKKVLN
jgi:hypothetical protein